MLKDSEEIDFNKISKSARTKGFDICATNSFELAMSSKDMEKCFGDDWYMDLPMCPTSDYTYLNRIIDAVKEALNSKIN